MKAKILIVILTLTGIAGCTKSSYTTSPQLTFESLNGSIFPQNSLMDFRMQVTDKEGDIQDTMWVQKITYSCVPDGNLIQPYTVPYFTPVHDLKAQIDVNLSYGAGLPSDVPGCVDKNDSCYFRFWLKDAAGNVSDTVSSPTLLLLK